MLVSASPSSKPKVGRSFFRLFFPKTPIADDVEFVRILQGERILAVPGVGFGMAGYIRLAFCVPERTITDSLPSFRRAMAAVRR